MYIVFASNFLFARAIKHVKLVIKHAQCAANQHPYNNLALWSSSEVGAVISIQPRGHHARVYPQLKSNKQDELRFPNATSYFLIT